MHVVIAMLLIIFYTGEPGSDLRTAATHSKEECAALLTQAKAELAKDPNVRDTQSYCIELTIPVQPPRDYD